MADVRPFCAIHPAKGYESRIAALPYDVYNRKEAAEKVKNDPLSFLNIDRPETQFPSGYDMYAPEVYQKAHDMLYDQIRSGFYVQDPQKCYYLYELTMKGRSQTGLVALSSIDDYCSGVIKKHENTRAEKEKDRIRHVETCRAQTGPIFLAYRKNETISAVTEEVKKTKSVFDFTSEDGIRHRGWTISDDGQIRLISSAFAGISSIYIADGHHRAASAVKVGLKMRELSGNSSGEEEYNYFLSVLFPDEELMILDYNRVVRDLNGMSEEEFIEKLKSLGDLEKTGPGASLTAGPLKKGEVCVLLKSSGWFRLTFRNELLSDDPVEGLDVAILQKYVLDDLIGIHDPTTDQRIDFVGGIRGLDELERRVRSDCAAAFAMYPTSIVELFAVADAGLLMPPKSTWFEPKLRSGLYIHTF